MSDWEGEYDPPFPEWDGRPEDDDFSLDPEMIGRVPLVDDGSVWADIWRSDPNEPLPPAEDFTFTPLRDLLGLPNDEEDDNPILNWADYEKEQGDEIRRFPNREAAEKFFQRTGFTGKIYVDYNTGIFYGVFKPSP